MTIEKTIQGAYQISDIIDGHLVTRTYYGHTKREAKLLFKYEFREKIKGEK